MKCTDARKVWNHSGGFIAGVKEVFPGVIEHLEKMTRNLINGTTNSFDTAVKQIVGGSNTDSYYLEHGEDDNPVLQGVHEVVGDAAGKVALEKHLFEIFGQKVVLGNVCCSGCRVSRPPVDGEGCDEDELTLRIQEAAIRLNSDGSEI